MNTPNSGRDALLLEALEPTAACPPLAELIEAGFSEFAGSRGEEIRSHAESCSRCSAELALAGAFDATPRNAAEAVEIAQVVAGLENPVRVAEAARPPLARVLPMAPHRERRARQVASSTGGALWQKWAAAALVVIGLGLLFEWGHQSFGPSLPGRDGTIDADVVRSGELRILAPAGILEIAGAAALPEFAWQPLAGVRSYRVELVDVGGEVLWMGESAEPRLVPSEKLRSAIETFVTYRLRITPLDGAKRPLAAAASSSFRIEPPSR